MEHMDSFLDNSDWNNEVKMGTPSLSSSSNLRTTPKTIRKPTKKRKLPAMDKFI